jgi:glycosyltransferase involved in cell wall biosynthesis
VIVHTFHGHVFHSYFGKLQTAFYKRVERWLAKKSNAIITISEKQKQEIGIDHTICPIEKIRVIPLGFDLNRFRERQDEKRKAFRQEYHIRDEEIVVSIIGRLVPVKNHALFLDAIHHLKENTKQPFRAMIVGDGELREQLESRAKELDIDFTCLKNPATITFTSWIKDVDRVLAGSDLICLSSWNEGTPVSLIEAQAAGKAVLSTRVGGIENIVAEGETAVLTAPGDTAGFSKQLLRLIENPMLLKSMGEKGWAIVGERFHYTRLVNDMKHLYYELLNAKKQP